MVKRSSLWIATFVLASTVGQAQSIKMKWGLENEHAYKEELRADDQDLSIRPAASESSRNRKYRTFAFSESPSVVNTMLRCFERHDKAWDRYLKLNPGGGNREDFNKFKEAQDPFCAQNAKQQAPSLYFDFVAPSNQQIILESVEVETLGFSEYKGGGFVEKEGWYDILLANKVGRKLYDVEPRLVFTGAGRATLRFWSDNFYPTMGWMAPMGEYKLKITFIFSTDKGTEKVSTDVFKIDV
jgi:hypothetical protein